MMVSVDRLKEVRDALPPSDQGFADSLIRQYERKNVLSGKQWHWVGVLVGRVASPEYEEPPKVAVGDLAKLHALFGKARKHLKYPKIRLQTEDGRTVELYVAGERSKYRGQVMVTDGGRYSENVWYGVIDKEGNWTQPRRGVPQEIEVLVRKMAEDPAGTAAEYGRLTGKCCFCTSTLSDGRSTEVGYGPVCADRYGLPWGSHK